MRHPLHDNESDGAPLAAIPDEIRRFSNSLRLAFPPGTVKTLPEKCTCEPNPDGSYTLRYAFVYRPDGWKD